MIEHFTAALLAGIILGFAAAALVYHLLVIPHLWSHLRAAELSIRIDRRNAPTIWEAVAQLVIDAGERLDSLEAQIGAMQWDRGIRDGEPARTKQGEGM